MRQCAQKQPQVKKKPCQVLDDVDVDVAAVQFLSHKCKTTTFQKVFFGQINLRNVLTNCLDSSSYSVL